MKLKTTENKSNILATGGVLGTVFCYIILVKLCHVLYSVLILGIGDLTSAIGFFWILQFILKKRRSSVVSLFDRINSFIKTEVIGENGIGEQVMDYFNDAVEGIEDFVNPDEQESAIEDLEDTEVLEPKSEEFDAEVNVNEINVDDSVTG